MRYVVVRMRITPRAETQTRFQVEFELRNVFRSCLLVFYFQLTEKQTERVRVPIPERETSLNLQAV